MMRDSLRREHQSALGDFYVRRLRCVSFAVTFLPLSMNIIGRPRKHRENSMKLRAAALVAAFLAASAFGQQTENAIVIDAKDSATTAAHASLSEYLNGYRSSVDGQTIEYHSSDPDADFALLVRGERMAHAASWQTDPLPEPSGDSYQFIWLAG